MTLRSSLSRWTSPPAPGPARNAPGSRLAVQAVGEPRPTAEEQAQARLAPRPPARPAVRPGVVRPGVVRPGVVRPGVVRPGVVRPGVVRTGVVRPGVVRPGAVRPGAVRPGAVGPGAARPGAARPWRDRVRRDRVRRDRMRRDRMRRCLVALLLGREGAGRLGRHGTRRGGGRVRYGVRGRCRMRADRFGRMRRLRGMRRDRRPLWDRLLRLRTSSRRLIDGMHSRSGRR